MTWKQGVGPFTKFIGDISIIEYQQETVKYSDKVIIGKDQGTVVCSLSV